MNSIRYQVGNRIRVLRTELKLSQEKLAELAELNTSYIGQVERGEKNPSIETVYKISCAMNVDMAELFKNLSSPGKAMGEYPQAVYSMMLELDEKYRKCIYDIALAFRNMDRR